ncbi:hypothetical protein [Marinicrinis sediminis]|uniref:Uncharacterized protein n=1 Tax=Marinicrinis sediminis TaxID=1652465 RepID=A0ABW5RE09_9BACL
MPMKLRPMPLIITVVISALILFGTWFAYQHFAVKSPLLERVHNIDGVQHAEVEMTRDRVRFDLRLEDEASVRTVVQAIREQESKLFQDKNKDIDIRFEDSTSEEIEKWWSTMLFSIAQSMDQQRYSEIPELLNTESAGVAGLEAIAEMDEHHVYISIYYEGSTKHMMLPRKPSQLGVWPNEQVS